MKFIIFTILSAFIYLSNVVKCDYRWNRNNIPNEILSGNIKSDNNNYNVNGEIIIKNDCEFEIQNFYVNPELENERWVCFPLNTCSNTIKKLNKLLSGRISGTFF